MTDDHELVVFDEEPMRGKALNIHAWKGCASAFPDYVIYPHSVAEPSPGRVAVLGHTSGSHPGLSDQEEGELSVIWLRTCTTVSCAAGACSLTPQAAALSWD
jgi:hypothetical protein